MGIATIAVAMNRRNAAASRTVAATKHASRIVVNFRVARTTISVGTNVAQAQTMRFHRGDRLPVEYRHRNYVVDDWRAHSLSAPPRGYHWVQTGGDYVLVAIATGVILQLLLNH